MFTPLVPSSFTVPEKLVTPEFTFRKLTYHDTEIDYKAVMSSIDIIKQTRGGSWPEETLTFEDDQIDLAWHQREFENRSSFAYTIVSPDGSECLGCLYLYQPGFRAPAEPGTQVDLSFWVTQTAYDQGLYPVVYKTLDSWLQSAWPFKKYTYSNLVIPE